MKMLEQNKFWNKKFYLAGILKEFDKHLINEN